MRYTRTHTRAKIPASAPDDWEGLPSGLFAVRHASERDSSGSARWGKFARAARKLVIAIKGRLNVVSAQNPSQIKLPFSDTERRVFPRQRLRWMSAGNMGYTVDGGGVRPDGERLSGTEGFQHLPVLWLHGRAAGCWHMYLLHWCLRRRRLWELVWPGLSLPRRSYRGGGPCTRLQSTHVFSPGAYSKPTFPQSQADDLVRPFM